MPSCQGQLPRTHLDSMVSPEEQAQLKQIAPLKRFAEPEDIANAVAFLVSGDAAYVTGHVLHATGGLA